MKYIISERQLSVLITEQKNTSDPSIYPQCISRYVKGKGGLFSQKAGEIVKTKSGEQFIKIFKFPNYKFYSNGRVQKPDAKMTSYSCGTNKTDIIVDGVNLTQQKWQEEKGKYTTNYDKLERQKSENLLNNLDPHTIATVMQIATAFIPFVGPFISAGIGLADAALYYNEGDTKTAGMIGVFSIIPGVGGLAGKLGLSKWSAKALGEVGKKISLGSKLSPVEIQVANKFAQNRQLIQNEITKLGSAATVKAGSQSARTKLRNKAIAQTTGGVGKTVAGYGAVGVGYSKGYDYLQKDTPKIKSQSEGYDWNFVRTSFGSSGTKEENESLNKAWIKGWRPGQVVPQEFQTKQYQNVYAQESQDINSLNQLIAQAQGQK